MKKKNAVNHRYRLFLKGAYGTYYIEDTVTHRQMSLKTTDKAEATRLWQAKNDAAESPDRSFRVGVAYLGAADPEAEKRTWKDVIGTYAATHLDGSSTRVRIERAGKDKAIAPLLKLPLLRTRAEDIFSALTSGAVSTNTYLRRFQNFAVDCGWLPKPILPKKRWPKVRHKPKRAITQEEHTRILERETNPERGAFYALCWHTGGSSSDVAGLTADDIDWTNRLITYNRKKNTRNSGIRFGPECEAVLRNLPTTGALFPYLSSVRASDRATEFKQRGEGLGIKGVTIHSYRYSGAERAKMVGMPERFAQAALGHASKAVHRAYAKGAILEIPCLENMTAKRRERSVSVLTSQVEETRTLSA
jgi:integrase